MDITSNILAILLLIGTLIGTVFFFFKLKVKFIEWLFFNPCSISSIIFLVGFIIFELSGNRLILFTAILPIFFFGTLGMFLFSWKGRNIIPQIVHIIMTSNIYWAIHTALSQKDSYAPMIGLLFGILIFAPFIAIQQEYVKRHPDKFEEFLMDKNT
jgi:hypothetical protein